MGELMMLRAVAAASPVTINFPGAYASPNHPKTSVRIKRTPAILACLCIAAKLVCPPFVVIFAVLVDGDSDLSARVTGFEIFVGGGGFSQRIRFGKSRRDFSAFR